MLISTANTACEMDRGMNSAMWREPAKSGWLWFTSAWLLRNTALGSPFPGHEHPPTHSGGTQCSVLHRLTPHCISFTFRNSPSEWKRCLIIALTSTAKLNGFYQRQGFRCTVTTVQRTHAHNPLVIGAMDHNNRIVLIQIFLEHVGHSWILVTTNPNHPNLMAMQKHCVILHCPPFTCR